MKKYINKKTGNTVYAVQAIFDKNAVGELDRWALSNSDIDEIMWFSGGDTDKHRILNIVYKNGYDQSFSEYQYLTKSDKEDCFVSSVGLEDFEKNYQLYSEWKVEEVKKFMEESSTLTMSMDENLDKIPDNSPIPLESMLPPFGESVLLYTEDGEPFIDILIKSLTTVHADGENTVYEWYNGGCEYKYWKHLPQTGDFFNKNKNCEL